MSKLGAFSGRTRETSWRPSGPAKAKVTASAVAALAASRDANAATRAKRDELTPLHSITSRTRTANKRSHNTSFRPRFLERQRRALRRIRLAFASNKSRPCASLDELTGKAANIDCRSGSFALTLQHKIRRTRRWKSFHWGRDSQPNCAV